MLIVSSQPTHYCTEIPSIPKLPSPHTKSLDYFRRDNGQTHHSENRHCNDLFLVVVKGRYMICEPVCQKGLLRSENIV